MGTVAILNGDETDPSGLNPTLYGVNVRAGVHLLSNAAYRISREERLIGQGTRTC